MIGLFLLFMSGFYTMEPRKDDEPNETVWNSNIETEPNSNIKYSYNHNYYKKCKLFTPFLEETQFVQKVTIELFMDFKQNHHRSWKYIQKLLLSNFKSFLHKGCKTHNYFFCDSAFYFFIRKTVRVHSTRFNVGGLR